MADSSRRLALLKATVTVVARGGLRALTYRAVAAEAGVSHGLVRHHFGSREQLIADAVDYAVTESLRASNMFGSGSDPRDDEHFASGIESLAERHTDIQAFQYEVLLESRRRPELRPHVERYYATYRNAIAQALVDLGIDDDALATAVWFMLDGLVFNQLVLPGNVTPALEKIRTMIGEELRHTH